MDIVVSKDSSIPLPIQSLYDMRHPSLFGEWPSGRRIVSEITLFHSQFIRGAASARRAHRVPRRLLNF